MGSYIHYKTKEFFHKRAKLPPDDNPIPLTFVKQVQAALFQFRAAATQNPL